MKLILKLEYLGGVLLSLYLFTQLPFAWRWYPVLFLAPDLSMAGYLFGPKVGAATYNVAHHLAVAAFIYVLGGVLGHPLVQLAGSIMIGHLFFDRIFGYGLKYADSFKSTHLGAIGPSKR
ncbi:MAG: DUF4260 domain-containing protein [bacterium]